MRRIARIGSLLKKIYRSYNHDLLANLKERGFTDLRPSFLEILTYICENEGQSIKDIGLACGLKKQTMTGHVNELTKRGYIVRRTSERDKREQLIFLTAYGERFKLTLSDVIFEVEESYRDRIGDVELDRIEHILSGFNRKLSEDDQLDLFSVVDSNKSDKSDQIESVL